MKFEKMKKSELLAQVKNAVRMSDSWEHAYSQANDTIMNLRARATSRKRFGIACGALGFSLGAFLTVLVLWLLA